MRTLMDIDYEIELVVEKLERYGMMYAFLEAEKKMLLQIEAGRKAAAEIETEKLMERMKK